MSAVLAPLPDEQLFLLDHQPSTSNIPADLGGAAMRQLVHDSYAYLEQAHTHSPCGRYRRHTYTDIRTGETVTAVEDNNDGSRNDVCGCRRVWELVVELAQLWNTTAPESVTRPSTR